MWILKKPTKHDLSYIYKHVKRKTSYIIKHFSGHESRRGGNVTSIDNSYTLNYNTRINYDYVALKGLYILTYLTTYMSVYIWPILNTGNHDTFCKKQKKTKCKSDIILPFASLYKTVT